MAKNELVGITTNTFSFLKFFCVFFKLWSLYVRIVVRAISFFFCWVQFIWIKIHWKKCVWLSIALSWELEWKVSCSSTVNQWEYTKKCTICVCISLSSFWMKVQTFHVSINFLLLSLQKATTEHFSNFFHQIAASNSSDSSSNSNINSVD